ncbi:MAG: Rieske (2Fe-2S) protein [Actinobacteria bacterium]|nr:Rieske (2Fe-2S) protein [Actinomycetota bacterium]
MSDDTTTRVPAKTDDSVVKNPYSWPANEHQPPPRTTDLSERAAKRAARQVATMFLLSGVFVALFFVAFTYMSPTDTVEIPYLGEIGGQHVALGLTFGMAVFLIGAGTVHWAKKLMSNVEVVQPRHDFKSTPEDTQGALEVFEEGVEASTWKKHPVIRRTLLFAMALVPLPFIISLRDLWLTPPGVPNPDAMLQYTIWTKGQRLVRDITGEPVRAEEIPVGGLVNCNPEDLEAVEETEGNLNARAKAAIIVIRMEPDEIQSLQIPDGAWNGIIAFSKICTHVGCPISLYQQRTHELLCPCHQSTFDLSDSANVVFGPAGRHMPQLPITVDDEGYLIAQSDFLEPVGPSFWTITGEVGP